MLDLIAKRHLALLGIVLGVVAVNVIVLSPGLLGVSIGGSAIETAAGVTLLLGSVMVLIYSLYFLLIKPPEAIPVKEIKSHDDYIVALSHYKSFKSLESKIELGLHQLERLKMRMDMLVELLNQRFDPNEITHKKFLSVAQSVEQVFYLNVRGVLARLRVFDESEYKRVMNPRASKLPPHLVETKAQVYNEFLSFIRDALGTNEEILLKIDKLLMEISRLDSIDPADIEKMPCMQEIDSLIKQTKLYKD